MSKYKYIIATEEGRIGRITLNRPEVHNALNLEMIREISLCMKHFNRLSDTKIILIDAKGQSFSAGADLHWMKAGIHQNKATLLSESKELALLFHEIYNSEKIIMTVAQGKVIGGANGIIAASDIAIGRDDATFTFSEVRLGLIPATIAPYVIAKCGNSVTMEWMLTGRKIEVAEALQKNLISHVFNEIEFGTKVSELTSKLLKNSPVAMAGIKSLFRKEFNNVPAELIKRTSSLIAEFRTSEEGQEGIRAFFEKRNPKWIDEKA